MINAPPFSLLLQLTSPEKPARVCLNVISPNEMCFHEKHAGAGYTSRDKAIILIESH